MAARPPVLASDSTHHRTRNMPRLLEQGEAPHSLLVQVVRYQVFDAPSGLKFKLISCLSCVRLTFSSHRSPSLHPYRTALLIFT